MKQRLHEVNKLENMLGAFFDFMLLSTGHYLYFIDLKNST